LSEQIDYPIKATHDVYVSLYFVMKMIYLFYKHNSNNSSQVRTHSIDSGGTASKSLLANVSSGGTRKSLAFVAHLFSDFLW
jgi:hypothetical protein